MPKKVLIAGFTGAMGQKAVSLVNQLSNFELVAGFAPKAVNEPERSHLPKTAQIFNQLRQIPDHAADIWIDSTTPAAVYDNVYFALQHYILTYSVKFLTLLQIFGLMLLLPQLSMTMFILL